MRGEPSTARLARFVSFLRRGIVDEGDAEEMFASLLELLGACGAVIADGWEAPTWHLTRGVPESWIRDHGRLRQEDPSRGPLQSMPAGTWWCLERDITDEERRRELLECFGRTGLRDAAIARLYSPLRDDIALAVYTEARLRLSTAYQLGMADGGTGVPGVRSPRQADTFRCVAAAPAA